MKNKSIENPPKKIVDELFILLNQDQIVEVNKRVNALIARYPNYYVLWNILGAAQLRLNYTTAAEEAFRKVTELNPKYAAGFNNLGNALKNQGKFSEANEAYKKAIELKPDYPVAYNNMGTTLLDNREFDSAIKAFQKAVNLKPDFPEAHSNIGRTLRSLGKFEEAVEAYRKATRLRPNYPEAYNNMGNALLGKGDVQAAIKSYKKAIELKFDYVDAYYNIGNVLKDQNKFEEAEEVYNKVIKLQPSMYQAHHNKGLCLSGRKKLSEAIESYNIALNFKPDFSLSLAQKLFSNAQICDWSTIREDFSELKKLGDHKNAFPPFSVLSLEDSPELHKQRSISYAKKEFPLKSDYILEKPVVKHSRIRIGYFSSDFKKHPVAYLIAKVIESHDRRYFEVFGYSLGIPSRDKMRERLKSGFDHFKDVNSLSDAQIVQIVKKDEIDIAIDLTGYTRNARTEIFSHRLAPIQINYLGYPGTMGADFIDYIIADQNLIPNEFQRFYTEKPIYLPHHYQAQDDGLEIDAEAPTRSSLGLPNQGFVFCAINNTYKITPREFDVWMRLLKKVKGSVLWLLESNKWVKSNLIKEASARGISSKRLIFAQRVPHSKYLAQFRQADLYLDTFNYNAGATASNALWAGVPILTKQGDSYTARMASSLLKSIGLPELVTSSEADYEDLALELAQNPKKLQLLRQKLSTNRTTMPLFNTKLFTKHLENGYQQAYQRYCSGQPPEVITVTKDLS